MARHDDDFERQLAATFRAEALEQLQRLETSLVVFEQGGANGAKQPGRILGELHTLKGASRAAGRTALEQLCHALETVISAAGRSGGPPDAGQFDLLHQAAALGRELLDPPAGRILNRARDTVARLDQLARALEGAQASEPGSHGSPQDSASMPDAAPLEPDPPAISAPIGMAVKEAEAAIRVPLRHLDAIRHHAEELLLLELDLDRTASRVAGLAAYAAPDVSARALQLDCRHAASELASLRHRFSMLRNRLLDSALETAMEPFSSVLGQLPALVRGLARNAGKQAQLRVEGEHIRVDRRVLEPMRDVLMHLVTNAVDHGIEAPAQRRKLGKPEAGHVSVTITQANGNAAEVTVADDGRGLDLEAVTAAAMAGGQLCAEEAQRLDDAQRAQLVFRAGLSTANRLTRVSGRGVGLAVVAEKLAAVGGDITVSSAPGEGCRFRLWAPVRLSRLLGLWVRVAGQRFVLPIAPLQAVFALSEQQRHMVSRMGTLRWNDRLVPAISLSQLFGLPAAVSPAGAEGHAVLAQVGGSVMAMLVDEIGAEQEVLPKNLGPQLRRVRYVSGATQLADGALVPILSLEDILRFHRADAPAARSGLPAHPGPARLLVAEDSVTSRLLLKHILEGAGYQVETVADGLDALARLRQKSFDALVSDVNMPGLDGFSLCEKLRAEPATAALPVVLVTSLQSPAEKQRGLLAGANSYLSKGAFDQDALIETLGRLV